ncbi:hypothetical protein RB620_09045 [Paenibacillus sp. LHD-117]|uniref:hypothetical protein n=1 Tax=Paenibacillus sp. LHD-117 TaxID=3071412 RepID=UPI0027E105F3|nr:hypothetical protein [Paenibacillus sp. LHD-117]MDQ6419576.1 hypothetical protein [Paenibacillus sp. LHD-117]
MDKSDRHYISEEEMILEMEEFARVFPILMHEIDYIESLRGKLNDFQLMLAVSRAKDSMSIVGWERRQTINAILEKYAYLYREYSREDANEWVSDTFGFVWERNYAWVPSPGEEPDSEAVTAQALEEGAKTQAEVASASLATDAEDEAAREAAAMEVAERAAAERANRRMHELSSLITVKESELLQLYRELYRLSGLQVKSDL